MNKRPELTATAVVGAMLVSAIIAFSYPFVVLKLGIGPNASVLSAFIGAAVLGVVAHRTRGANSLQNNLIQTAGTSAASTAFMCVILAACGYLDANPMAHTHLHPGGFRLWLWLTLASLIGIVIAALLRPRFLSDPTMRFVDGQVAATTIKTLDGTDDKAKSGLRVLGVGALVGSVLAFARDGLGKLALTFIYRPLNIGIEWSLLSFGSGLLLPWQMGIWMLVGVGIVRFVGPIIVSHAAETVILNGVTPDHVEACRMYLHGVTLNPEALAPCGQMAAYLHGRHAPVFLMWAMWPATAAMIISEFTKIAIAASKTASPVSDEQSMAVDEPSSTRKHWIAIGLLTLVLAIVQKSTFNMPIWMTFVGVTFGFPIVLVGVRVLGQTNIGPVSVMANTLQAVFRLFSPLVGFNLITAGTAGCINSQGEGTMQDYKTGQILGSNPRALFLMQSLGALIGALGVTVMYPILVARYPLGEGLAAPTGLKLANMAMLLGRGIDAFPPGALLWSLIAAGIAVVCALLSTRSKSVFIPNVTALGIALILPGFLTIPMACGALAGGLWQKLSPQSYEEKAMVLASGFVGGEALIGGLVLPILFALGWLTPP